MKKIYGSIILAVLLCSVQLHAQERKMNIALYRYITNPKHMATNSAKTLPVLVKGDIGKIRSYVINHGGIFKYAVANKYASVVLPISTINDFSQSDFVNRVEGVYQLPRGMSDSVGCYRSHVFPVQDDSALSRGYLGDSVVVGIIDAGGFDFHHRDFKQPYDSTKTRFLYIWDQTNTGGPGPAGFNYGTVWDSAQINAGLCKETEPIGDNSHGTNCIGVAAGNGLSYSPSKTYIGVAPAANIIGVKFIGNQDWESYVVDAANYIYSQADSIHEPCVITLSYGSYLGSHDGQNLATLMLDSLISEHAGRAFVAACGDGGGVKEHLGYSAKADSQFTWFSQGLSSEAFEFWIDTDQASNFNFAIGADEVSNLKYAGRSPYFNISDFEHIGNPLGAYLINNGDTIFETIIEAEQQANAYHFIVDILTSTTYESYVYRFITQGSGRFDLWSQDTLTGTWSMGSRSYEAYFPVDSPYFKQYVYPDSLQTICSDFQCSPYVISVANYCDRNNYVECSGTTYTTTDVPGPISPTSSFGPTRDNRVEPDITAPGNTTIAPGDSATIAAFLKNGNAYKVTEGCKYNRNGGTSLAAPFAAGVAALYLEKYPYATWKNVKAAIDSCAYKDTYTTATPSKVVWGYGKVNAYCIMEDTPTSVVQPIVHDNSIELKNYPNPFSNSTNIVYSLGKMSFQYASIEVFDMLGQKVATMPINSSSGTLQFNNDNLPQGMYIYRLVVNSQPLAEGKFTIIY